MLTVAELAGRDGRQADRRADPALPPAAPHATSASRSRPTARAGGCASGRRAATMAQTGVEMEALTAAAVAALTVYDMVKARRPRRRDPARAACSRRAAASPGSGTGRRGRGAPRRPPSARGRAGAASRGHVDGPRRRWRKPREIAPRCVLTVSDGVAAGTRQDTGGARLAERLAAAGLRDRPRRGCRTMPDAIVRAVRQARRAGARLVVTTGGTGLDRADAPPRRCAPSWTTRSPASASRCAPPGRRQHAARGPVAFARRVSAGRCLDRWPCRAVPRGAVESLDAVLPLLRPRPGDRSPADSQHACRDRMTAGALMPIDLRAHPALPARCRSSSSAPQRSSASRWRATCASSPRPGRPRDRPAGAALRRAVPLRASCRCACSATRTRAFLHAAIFWGFVILTIGTADRVTFGLVHGRRRLAAGRLAVAAPAGGPEPAACWRARRRRLGARAAAGPPAARLTLSRDGLTILLPDRRRGAHRAAGGELPHRPLRRPGRGLGVRCQRAGAAARAGRSRSTARSRVRALLLGEHPRGQLLPGLLAALQAPAHRHRVLQHAFRKLRPRGELPAMDLEAETARFGVKTIEDLRLEGPARRLHLHRVRALPGRLPGLGDRQAAQPQDDDHGHPRDVGWRRRRGAAHPVDPAVRDGTAATQAGPRAPDRGQRDPLRCGLGLRHLWGLRGGLPGAHRARRQDRRAAPEPGARGEPLPGGADGRLHGHGALRQPVGPARPRTRLDWAKRPAVRGAHRGAIGGRRRGRMPWRSWSASTGSAARPPSTTATSASRARS